MIAPQKKLLNPYKLIAFFPFLLYCFIIITLINCGFYTYISRFSFSTISQSGRTNNKGVSVLVCAKNEEKNLLVLIPKLLTQDYPQFQIILINDHSEDQTLQIMQGFTAQNSSIKIVDLKQETGKKAGITKGIQQAQYEHLLFTDADCLPQSKHWISEMAAQFSNEKQIILGYSGYSKIANSWLNKVIRFETLLTAMQYFAYAKNKNTYMGVGRNLAYTKTLFLKNNGFANHAHLKPGDDDLFVNQNATKTNVTLCSDPSSFTISNPKKSWKEWFYQKRRHTSVSHHYKLKHQLQLGAFYVSQFLFFFLFLILVLFNQQYVLALSLFLFRELAVCLITSKAALKLQEKELIPYLLVLEPFLVSTQMLIFIANILVKPRRWN
ncbi:MAG: glycosyltransferase [Leeuwenhoekiella marinoflava]